LKKLIIKPPFNKKNEHPNSRRMQNKIWRSQVQKNWCKIHRLSNRWLKNRNLFD